MFWDMMGWMSGEKDTNVNENKKHQKSAYLKAMTIHGVKDGRGLFGPTYIVDMMASCRQWLATGLLAPRRLVLERKGIATNEAIC